MISIVNFGIGNIASLAKMFEAVGATVQIAETPADISAARTLVLPGIGQFAAAMAELKRRDFIGPLTDKVVGEGTPILGICLGMQLFGKGSEEGGVSGLGWLDADVVRFQLPDDSDIRLPNIGWRPVTLRTSSSLFPVDEPSWRFYFAHSYHMRPSNPDDALAFCTHGVEFMAAVAHGNISGTQFHPEKSHRFGKRLLEGFLHASHAMGV
ncbi:imidazole glycerol phosphate synthase subunit HisH [Azospirillum tabaci]|uniref:imidazole glycerol phosphate synthase subunit HisH n=1 Tax=Azospirillum tabaci TaxID=2752310 RepID=UPI0016607D17|nr:imidazole glycerol phosphate synthase subunit HisH [Azospirillum tabaci]